ncbi:MAG: penicillin-binding protein 1B, partial [Methylococcaceae bacterium]|nr:penicillin-binding protein 1B [Methylococcaceae bacterium]
MIPLLILLLYVGYLDSTVKRLFEGKRWAIPAHVYASPVELYAGLPLTPAGFESVVQRLRYRRDPSLSTEGTYDRSGRQFRVKTRSFRFWDQAQPGHGIMVQFSNGAVQSIRELNGGRNIAILRMDPAQIGSFYPAHNEDRVLVKLDQVPKTLIQALLATEDRDFYAHHGISLKAIARAVFANIRAGSVVQGGSTITQQLAKNFYLSSDREWGRKVNEALIAIILETRYSKDEILETYLNEIFLGQEGRRAIHGFGLASRYYFDRSLGDLELYQTALLVGLVKGASYYDPRRQPERARQRRNLVIDGMVALELITPAQAESAKQKPLEVSYRGRRATTQYPAFMDLVRRQLKEQYRDEDLTSEGLQILTTLEVPVQEALEYNAARTLRDLEKSNRTSQLQIAGVVTSREGGDIVALLGGRDPRFAGLNRALDIQRLIGSLVKPAVYLTALEDSRRYNVVTELDDSGIRMQSGGKLWAPRNFDKREHGPVSLHQALTNSYNLATIRLGLDVGIGRVVKTLHNLGIERDVAKYPSILLGALELSPLEVTQMYQTLAGDGFKTPLRAIRSVIASDGTPLQRYPLTVTQTVDPAAVFLTNVLLQNVMREGTGRSVYSMIPRHYNVAGKTGTTNDLRDSWFAGFSGDYLGVVWIGRDDNKPTGLTGSSGALRVWSRLMRDASKQPVDLIPPESIEWVWIDRKSGLRADEGCKNAVEYPFISGSAP